MPELPEAETIRRQIEAYALGQKAIRFDIYRDDYVVANCGVSNRSSLKEVRRWGKKVILGFGNVSVVFSLGMSGNLLWVASPRELEKHTHLVVRFERGGLHIVDPRRFGSVYIAGNDDVRHYLEAKLGPDILSVTEQEFVARANGRKIPIKALLLDQKFVAGIGNIYADETLYSAKIHPLSTPDNMDTDEIAKVFRAAREVLERAIEMGGSTISTYSDADGGGGYFQIMHRVYGKAGEQCVGCGTIIQKIEVRGRSTYFCPACQTK